MQQKATTTRPLKESWQKETEKQEKKEEEGLLLILPSLSPRPPLHRLFPPPPPLHPQQTAPFSCTARRSPRHHLRANAGTKWKWEDQSVQVNAGGAGGSGTDSGGTAGLLLLLQWPFSAFQPWRKEGQWRRLRAM